MNVVRKCSKKVPDTFNSPVCFKLYADRMISARFDHQNEHAEVHFLIVNVANDEKVLSAVKEREEKLLQRGYEKVIALRDMYSEAYRKRADHTINDIITEDFIKVYQEIISKMSDPNRIKMCFAIMELEAWFLGIYNIFEQLDPVLTVAYIEENLGFDISAIDPQKTFFKPTDVVSSILQLVGRRYKKSEHDIESICSKINEDNYSKAFENGRCMSFKNFCDEVLN